MKKRIPILFLFLSYNCVCSFSQSNQSSSLADCVAAKSIKIKNFGNKFKVVIGNEIKYKSKGDKTLPMLWKMGKLDASGNYSDLFTFSTNQTTIVPPVWKDGGSVFITKDQLPMNNNDFGLTRGNVFVETSLSPPVSNVEQVKVFFNKDDINIHDPTVPNWFYYWSQNPLIDSLLSIPGFTLFDTASCKFNNNPTPLKLKLKYDSSSTYSATGSNEYGTCHFDEGNMEKYDPYPMCDKNTDPPRTVLSSYSNTSNTSTTITIGKSCGYDRPLQDGSIIKGIHVFYTIIFHEREHAIIECENWDMDSLSIGVGKGYSSLWDKDRDGYKDVWEVLHGSFTVEPNPFVGKKDRYGLDINGNSVIYNSSQLGMGLYSAGTEYEEARCRGLELKVKATLSNIDQYDWSFDILKKIQGKQW